MCRHYRKPILLIEFDSSRAFALNAAADITSDISASSIISKLSLLCIHFPALRVLWSRDPDMTADMFYELKQLFDEPEEAAAMAAGASPAAAFCFEPVIVAAGANSTPQSNDHAWDFTPMDVLRALPGVTENNYHQLAAKVLCLQDLFVMSLAAIQAIIGAENGRKLHSFINTQVRRHIVNLHQRAAASHARHRHHHRYDSS